ncbi:MAG: TetR/AcrR family transcriptional regulator [Methylobacteriaceae bacterium]|nr:TetR/AcrR family transcriptional regulator [Methylobacteriaceae bacterium]
MKPRSQLVSGRAGRRLSAEGEHRPARGTPRLDPQARKAMIVEKAIIFFADYGLTAQTRALAESMGVTQRLLYRYFPSKTELLRAVYEAAILAPFKALWMVQLSDRSLPIRERLIGFYGDYSANLLTRRWLRLFLYASLGETDMAHDYIQAIVARLLDLIAAETAAELGVALPDDPVFVREAAWVLHGSISHYAIRQHVYGAASGLTAQDIVPLNVDLFLAGFAAAMRSRPAAGGPVAVGPALRDEVVN